MTYNDEATRVEFLKRIEALEYGLNLSLEETYSDAIRQNSEGLLPKSQQELIQIFQSASIQLKTDLTIPGCDPKQLVSIFQTTCDHALERSKNISPSLKERLRDFLNGFYALFGYAQVTNSRERHQSALPKMEETINAIKAVYANLMPNSSKTVEKIQTDDGAKNPGLH